MYKEMTLDVVLNSEHSCIFSLYAICAVQASVQTCDCSLHVFELKGFRIKVLNLWLYHIAYTHQPRYVWGCWHVRVASVIVHPGMNVCAWYMYKMVHGHLILCVCTAMCQQHR